MPFALPNENSKPKSETEAKLAHITRHLDKNEKAMVRKAYLLAEDAHKFQKRLSGEPYIIHPLSVAEILSNLEMDCETICAALLHDVLEDTDITREYMDKEFGPTVTKLVDGVTKISEMKNQSRENRQAVNIRKMILATVDDARVIIIKLADKMHNMQTLSHQAEHKRERISREVLDIYAPLAGRLGMYGMKAQLEDFALSHLDSTAYQQIKEAIAEKKADREDRIKVTKSIIESKLRESKIRAKVLGRTKHFYSIYQKMKEQHKSIDEIYDLSGVRVLVDSIQDCYTTLGVIHTIWNPVPGRFKDYISLPKSNGYRSLHTGVIGTGGKYLEVQIRTQEMQNVAEYGIAAHWAYKEKEKNAKTIQDHFHLLQNIAQMQDEGADEKTFMEDLKTNLSVSEDVYVFTPKGEIIAMPMGSTVLDFAFRIHTEIGLSCTGGKIGNKPVSIRTALRSGDQVHIISSPHAKPNANWLRFLVTPQARSKLRSFLRKRDGDDEPAEVRTETAEKERKNDEVVKPKARPKREEDSSPHWEVEWEGQTGFETRFAHCCSPLPGDPIEGYLSKNHVVSVHKKGCPSLHTIADQEENSGRLIPLRWKGQTENYSAKIEITGSDRPLLFLDLVSGLTRAGANILGAEAHTTSIGEVRDRFNIEVDSKELLETILSDLSRIPGVLSVYHII